METKDFSILIVEDSVAGRNLALRMVNSLGYQASAAKDAAEALDFIVQGQHFDVLFTDILMPGDMDGIKLAHAARALMPVIKILFTSGFSALPADGVDDLDARFVGKPYRRAEIGNILHGMLKF